MDLRLYNSTPSEQLFLPSVWQDEVDDEIPVENTAIKTSHETRLKYKLQ